MAAEDYQRQHANEFHPSQPHLNELPSELADLILEHLEKKELKSLRLASKKYRDATTSQLFQCFTLYPHMASFDRLLAIANTPVLSNSIEELEINTAFRGLARVPPRYLVPPKRELCNRFRRVDDKFKKRKLSDQIAEVAAALRMMYSKTFAGGNTSDELSQMVHLQDIFPKLMKLWHLRVTDACSETDLPHFYCTLLPGFCTSSTKAYSHLLQDFSDTEDVQQSYALGVLAAARSVSSLRTFQMHGLDWEDLMGTPDLFRRPLLFRDTLARLQHLELTTQMAKHHWDGDVTLNLQAMLRLAVNLQTLVLWFRKAEDAEIGGEALYDWAYDEHCKSNFQLGLDEHDEDFEGPIEMPARLTWSSKLRHLDLKGLVCTAEEMQSILGYCATGLKSLELSDIILMPQTKTGPRSCLVKFFKWMQQHLQLEELVLEGFFTNGGMQDWTFLDESEHSNGQENLRAKTLRFVLNGGTCPLDHVEIPDGYFDLGKLRYKKEAPRSLKKDEKYQGDDSLYMGYHDHEDVPSDDEDDDDEEDEGDTEEDEDTNSDTDGSETAAAGEDDEWESASEDSLD